MDLPIIKDQNMVEREVIAKRFAERSSGNVEMTSPAEVDKDFVREELFGEALELEAVHPEVADQVAGYVADAEVKLDPRARDAIIFASEMGVPHGEVLRRSFEAIARTSMNRIKEVTIEGPGGDQLQHIERRAFKLAELADQAENSNQVNYSDLIVTEEIARSSEPLNPYNAERVLIPDVSQKI